MTQRHWTLQEWVRVLAVCAALATCINLSATAAVIELDTLAMGDGTVAEVPVTIAAEAGEEIASLQFDMHFDDATFDLVDVVPGESSSDALKQVIYSVRSPGVIRVIVAGLNQNVIRDGNIATVLLAPDAEDAVPQTLSLDSIVISDPFGERVEVDYDEFRLNIEGETEEKSKRNEEEDDPGQEQAEGDNEEDVSYIDEPASILSGQALSGPAEPGSVSDVARAPGYVYTPGQPGAIPTESTKSGSNSAGAERVPDGSGDLSPAGSVQRPANPTAGVEPMRDAGSEDDARSPAFRPAETRESLAMVLPRSRTYYGEDGRKYVKEYIVAGEQNAKPDGLVPKGLLLCLGALTMITVLLVANARLHRKSRRH
jgi:hypothetical protein